MKDVTPFLRDTEVAKRYGVSRSTIWRWVKDGKIPLPIKIGGGSTRWRFFDLEEWEKLQIRKNQK